MSTLEKDIETALNAYKHEDISALKSLSHRCFAKGLLVSVYYRKDSDDEKAEAFERIALREIEYSRADES